MKLGPPASISRPLRLPAALPLGKSATWRRVLPLVAAGAGAVVSLSLWFPGVWAAAWLLAALLAGAMLVQWLFPDLPVGVAPAAAYLSGLVVCALASFVAALALAPLTDAAVPLAGVLVAGIVFVVARRRRGHRALLRLRPAPLELVVLLAALLFSLWFYDRALSYDSRAGEVTFASGTYADIAVHVALARSFSWGANLPPEYPYYAGEPAHYHFGYDFTAGLLESLGLRLDLAFNLPAVLAYAALFLLVFSLGREFTGRAGGGVLAAITLPLSSSWAVLDYPGRWQHTPVGFFQSWWEQAARIHVGPYNGETISIHFTQVAYMIERQLLAGIAIGVLVVMVLASTFRAGRDLSNLQAEGLGALLGLSFLINGITWLATLAVAGALFLLFGRWRSGVRFGLYAVMVALPAAALVRGSPLPEWHPGFLTQPFTPLDYLGFWWENLGLLAPLAILGALLGTSADRRILLACFAPFVLGSLFYLGADPSGVNQKVFNFWIVLLKPFAAVVLLRVFLMRRPRRWAGPLAGAVLLALLIPSGLIDLAQIKNEGRGDLPGSDRAAVGWVAEETKPDARFLTAHWIMMPPSLAGRPLYLGYRPWAANAGYDVATREQASRRMYGAPSLAAACPLLRQEGIDYVQVGPVERDRNQGLELNAALWDGLPAVFDGQVPGGRLRYYRVADLCRS